MFDLFNTTPIAKRAIKGKRAILFSYVSYKWVPRGKQHLFVAQVTESSVGFSFIILLVKRSVLNKKKKVAHLVLLVGMPTSLRREEGDKKASHATRGMTSRLRHCRDGVATLGQDAGPR